ncbi:Hsp70 family protein [Methylocella sp.]|uniref:Hsp70 family protein n=1 Tax=Methylocella sp. TaxID=1978226 RepID=UPI0037838E21
MSASGPRLCGIGVDFGTTNSVVALAFEDGEVESLVFPSAQGPTPTFRSALAFWREGRRLAHACGPQALERALASEGEQRFIQSVKTYLGSRGFSETRLYGHRLTVEELIAVFLRDLLVQAPRGVAVLAGRPVVFAGENPDEALAVARLREAFRLAGVGEVELALEPMGAAYWRARTARREETALVADFGGGTSDFSVLRLSREKGRLKAAPLGHAGVGVAGDSFDYRIIEHVVAPKLGKGSFYRSFDKRLPIPAFWHAAFAQWHQLSFLKTPQTLAELDQLIKAAEEPQKLGKLRIVIEHDLAFELYRAVGALKAALSGEESARFSFSREGVDIEAQVSRRAFESWIADDLDRIGAATQRALDASGLGAEEIDAVFLTGGTSYVPAVRALFARRFGEGKIHVGDAFQSVASGLALMATDRVRA